MMCGCLLIYDLFIFLFGLNMPKAFFFFLLWLSPGTRGCVSVSEQNWKTKHPLHLLSTSVGKITLTLVHTHSLAYTCNATSCNTHRHTHIAILLTAEDSRLNLRYSSAAMQKKKCFHFMLH